tara:strand:+ start:315 stop:560 length:246 start_codon:yes stop_codon:yes gene_type:complete
MPIGGVVAAVAKKEKCQETSFQPTQPAKNQLSLLVCSVLKNCRLRVSAPKTIVKNDRDVKKQNVNVMHCRGMCRIVGYDSH